MRSPLLLAVAVLWTGCAAIYAPGVAAPGRTIPVTENGAGELSFNMDLGRNVADAVEVQPDGTLTAADSRLSVWPGLDLTFRQGIADGLGIEGRIGGSLLLPLPFPIPNGLSLAPIISLYRPSDSLRLDTTPRLVYVAGKAFTDTGSTRRDTEVKAGGLEVPVSFTWVGSEALALGATGFVRVFVPHGKATVNGTGGTQVRWLNLGGGLSGNLLLTLGRFRLGLGLAVELVANPAAGLEPCAGCESAPAVLVVPQGGLTFGGVWGAAR